MDDFETSMPDQQKSSQVSIRVQAYRQILVGVQLNQDDVSEFYSYEKPTYNYYEFISDIGGALGLILGLSVQVRSFSVHQSTISSPCFQQ